MDTTFNRFPYIYENLYSLSLLDPVVIFGWSIIIFGMFYLIRLSLLFWYMYRLVTSEQKAFEKKKHILSELILMKDIQSELETEIENAMIKNTVQ